MSDREQGFSMLLNIIKKEDIRLWVDNGVLNCEAVEGVITEELQQSIKEYKEELIEMLEKEKRKLDLPYQKEPVKTKESRKKVPPPKPAKYLYNPEQGVTITLFLKIFAWLFLVGGSLVGVYYIMENNLEVGLVIIFLTVLMFTFFLTFGAISTNIIDVKRMTANQLKLVKEQADGTKKNNWI